MEERIREYLSSIGAFDENDKSIAVNYITTSDNEVVLSGNKLGLIMLADNILNVALASFPGYHIHLDEDTFFEDTNLQLIIEKLDD